MIHLPYFEKLLSFAIRGLRVAAIPGGHIASIHRAAEKDSSRKPIYRMVNPYPIGPALRADFAASGKIRPCPLLRD